MHCDSYHIDNCTDRERTVSSEMVSVWTMFCFTSFSYLRSSWACMWIILQSTNPCVTARCEGVPVTMDTWTHTLPPNSSLSLTLPLPSPISFSHTQTLSISPSPPLSFSHNAHIVVWCIPYLSPLQLNQHKHNSSRVTMNSFHTTVPEAILFWLIFMSVWITGSILLTKSHNP